MFTPENIDNLYLVCDMSHDLLSTDKVKELTNFINSNSYEARYIRPNIRIYVDGLFIDLLIDLQYKKESYYTNVEKKDKSYFNIVDSPIYPINMLPTDFIDVVLVGMVEKVYETFIFFRKT